MWPQLESICVPISHPTPVAPVSHPKYSRPAKRRTHYLVVSDASNGRQQLHEAADMAGGHGEVDQWPVPAHHRRHVPAAGDIPMASYSSGFWITPS
jgi:hypothetical protein